MVRRFLPEDGEKCYIRDNREHELVYAVNIPRNARRTDGGSIESISQREVLCKEG